MRLWLALNNVPLRVLVPWLLVLVLGVALSLESIALLRDESQPIRIVLEAPTGVAGGVAVLGNRAP